MNKIMQKIRVGEPLSENEFKELGFQVKEKSRYFIDFIIRNGVSVTVGKKPSDEEKVFFNVIVFEKTEFEKMKNEILENDILKFLLRKVNAPEKILSAAQKSNSITIEDLEKLEFKINGPHFAGECSLKKDKIMAYFIEEQNKLKLTYVQVLIVGNDPQTLMFACKRAGVWKEEQY